MSLRRFHFAALAAAAFTAVFAAAAAAGPWALAPGEYYTEISGRVFSSGTYYDNDGNRMSLGGLYEQRALTSYTELGWKPRWSVQLGLPVLSNTVRAADGSTGTSSGFGDFQLGLRYALRNGPSATAVQFGWTAPAGYNAKLAPGLGSGLQRLEAAVEVGRALGGNGFVQLGGGYAYDFLAFGSRKGPEEAVGGERDWADHVSASAALGFWMGRLMVAGLYDGEIATSAGREEQTTAHLAGPRFTYRLDDGLDAFAGSWHSPGGENVLHVDQYYAGVAWKLTKLGRLQGFLGGDQRP